MTRVALAIETSNPSTGRAEVASAPLDKGGSVDLARAHVEALSSSVRHDDGLMPAVERAVTALGASPGDVGRVVVSVGPGGYTGLRVAVTTAKLNALATGAEVIGVPTALVARASAAASGAWDRALVCLASKKDRASAWRVDVEGASCVGVIDAGGVRAHADLGVVVGDPHLPESFGVAAGEAGMGLTPLELGGEALLRASMDGEACSPNALAPIYAREPDAVTQWRARHGG